MKYSDVPIYRPSKVPSVDLPFGARSVGHYTVRRGRVDNPVRKFFVQLFWGVQGRGRFLHRRRRFVLEPEHVFIYFPEDIHDVRAMTDPWEYRWLTLDGPLNVETIRSFGLGRNVRRVGRCPGELFDQLEACIRSASPAVERHAATIAFSILTAACGTAAAVVRQDAVVGDCMDIIDEEYADQDLTIQSLSARLGVHRSILSRRFKEKVGSPPQQYIISRRLDKAMFLLRETDLRVSEIAYRSGFRDPNYFARAFRKTMGMSPLEFRGS
jgi:AraC-like DNA-binding protein